MPPKLKSYLFIFLALELLLSYAPAFAQSTYSGVQSGITTYLCTPPANNASNDSALFTCINKLYKFAIVVATTLGVLFIAIAGYVYMNAGGNQESVDKAKNIFVSVITAIVILMVGYVLLRGVNPDLVQFQSIQPPNVNLPAMPGGSGGTTGGALTSVCAQNVGSCSVTQLQQCGSWDPNVASGICGHESSGVPTIPSKYDHCADGNPFTIGLFQINMINSASGVTACPAGIFSSTNGDTVQTDCLQKDSNGICIQWNCQVAAGMKSQYQNCVQALSDPSTNIAAACSLYQARQWKPWINSYNKCVQTAPATQSPPNQTNPPAATGGGVLLLGDSLMVGMQSTFSSSAQGAGSQVNSLSSAVSGASIQQITQTVSGNVSSLSGNPPQVAFVSLGTNNFAYTPSQIQSAASQMISALQQAKVQKIVWIGPPNFPQPNSSNITAQQNQDLNNALKNAAGGICFFDTYNSGLPLYSSGATNIHPGSQGYTAWANAIWNWYNSGGC